LKRGHLCLLVCLLLGVLLPAAAAASPRIGLLWWPADPANPANPFIGSLEKCLTKRLAQAYPNGTLVPSGSIRDVFFPLLEPAIQPASEADFAALLSRPEVRQRLGKRLDYLVVFSGGTESETRGGIICGAGYGGGGCLGLAWINKDTRIDVVIWALGETVSATHQGSRVEGTTWVPAFILPIPIPALTEAEACRDMSRQIVEFTDSHPGK
jgi:hypothetical protein